MATQQSANGQYLRSFGNLSLAATRTLTRGIEKPTSTRTSTDSECFCALAVRKAFEYVTLSIMALREIRGCIETLGDMLARRAIHPESRRLRCCTLYVALFALYGFFGHPVPPVRRQTCPSVQLTPFPHSLILKGSLRGARRLSSRRTLACHSAIETLTLRGRPSVPRKAHTRHDFYSTLAARPRTRTGAPPGPPLDAQQHERR